MRRFDDEEEYTCCRCGKRYVRGWMKCLVNHFRGDCCHYGDTPVKVKEEKGEVSERGPNGQV